MQTCTLNTVWLFCGGPGEGEREAWGPITLLFPQEYDPHKHCFHNLQTCTVNYSVAALGEEKERGGGRGHLPITLLFPPSMSDARKQHIKW